MLMLSSIIDTTRSGYLVGTRYKTLAIVMRFHLIEFGGTIGKPQLMRQRNYSRLRRRSVCQIGR